MTIANAAQKGGYSRPADRTFLERVPSGFPLPAFDTVTLAYTAGNMTSAVYTNAGKTVATLTLAYDGSNNLISVVRS